MLLLRGSSYLPQAQSTAQGHLRVNLAALAANIVNGGTTAADCRALRATRHLGGRGQHAVRVQKWLRRVRTSLRRETCSTSERRRRMFWLCSVFFLGEG